MSGVLLYLNKKNLFSFLFDTERMAGVCFWQTFSFMILFIVGQTCYVESVNFSSGEKKLFIVKHQKIFIKSFTYVRIYNLLKRSVFLVCRDHSRTHSYRGGPAPRSSLHKPTVAFTRTFLRSFFLRGQNFVTARNVSVWEKTGRQVLQKSNKMRRKEKKH